MGIDRSNGAVVVSAAGTDPLPIQKFARVVGYGKVTRRPDSRPNHRAMFVWRVSCAKAEEFLRNILPHLIVKKDQALLAMHSRTVKRSERGPLIDAVAALKRIEH